MKKMNQVSNILFLVAIAFFIKAFLDKNMSLVLVGILLIILGMFRKLVLKQAENIDDEFDNVGEDSIVRYLKRDPILYAEMMEVYRLGNCEILYEENDGILLYDHTSHEYLATANTKAGAKDILLKIPTDYEMLIVHDDVFLELENIDFKFANKLVFYNYLYDKRAKYKIPENNLEFKMLDDQYIPFVKEHYSVESLCNDQYIKSRIQAVMLGAFIDGKIVGFIGMHDNGAIGMLEVLEAYRRKHIGMLLQMMYTNYLLDEKYPGAIYSQVYENNEVSTHLQNKLLLKKSDKPSYWYFSN